MPRVSRRRSETGIYHIMLRGINKQDLFEEDEDRGEFLDALFRYKEDCDVALYAYCLMSNHVHLLLKENEQSVSNLVKRISSSYVYYYNWKYARTGHLFQERFKSEPVESDDYFLTVLRYIHQNPVKANLVDQVEEYEWSSYADYLEKKRIDYELALGLFGEFSKDPLGEFVRYNHIKNEDRCLDYKVRSKKSDKEVREIIKWAGQFDNVNEIQYVDSAKRKEVVGKLKRVTGISMRQIQRITGLSYRVVRES